MPRYRQVKKEDGTFEYVEVTRTPYRPVAPAIMGDISPYRSMVDGSVINSRSEHRAHLKAHGMVEMGNEMPSRPTQKSEAQQKHERKREIADVLSGYGI